MLHTNTDCIRSEILTTVNTSVLVFRVLKPCERVGRYQHVFYTYAIAKVKLSQFPKHHTMKTQTDR